VEEIKNAPILFVKPEGERPLGRHKRRWKNNVKMNLRESGCKNVDYIHLV
jgi:hypothetical protein